MNKNQEKAIDQCVKESKEMIGKIDSLVQEVQKSQDLHKGLLGKLGVEPSDIERYLKSGKVSPEEIRAAEAQVEAFMSSQAAKGNDD